MSSWSRYSAILGFLALSLLGCKDRSARAIDDHPDGIARDKLSALLTDLTFTPPAPYGERLSFLRYGRFFSNRLEPIAGFEALALDTLLGRDSGRICKLVGYRWDGSTGRFRAADTALIRNVRAVVIQDVSKDGLADALVFTGDSSSNGLTILGADDTRTHLIARYRSETSDPITIPMKDSTVGIVERGVFPQQLLSGYLAPAVPKRFFRLSGQIFVESADDPIWQLYLGKVWDSTQQVYLAQRSLNMDARVRIRSNHGAFTKALISETLLDQDLFRSHQRLNADLNDGSLTLTPTERAALEALASWKFATPYCEVANDSGATERIVALGGLNDALFTNDTATVRAALQRVPQVGFGFGSMLSLARSLDGYLTDRGIATAFYPMITPFLIGARQGAREESVELLRIGARCARSTGRSSMAEGLIERVKMLGNAMESQAGRK